MSFKKERKDKPEDLFALQHKAPPQNTDAEKALLGSILINSDSLHEIAHLLHARDFYLEAHQWMYESIIELEARSLPYDIIAIANRLEEKKLLERMGGVSFISDLGDVVATSAHIVHYANIIKDKAILRKIIQSSTSIISQSYGEMDDVASFLDRAEREIFEIRSDRNNNELTPVSDVVIEAFRRIEELYHRKELVTGTTTGFDKFDKMTSGLQPSDLIILAARPAMGKTSFALNIAVNAAIRDKNPVIIFSLEMSKEQLVMRMLCSEARVDQSRLRTGYMEESDIPRLTAAATRLNEAPIFIDDGGDCSILDVRAKCRRLAAKYDKMGLIVIDYLQLMRGSSSGMESREREISEISRGLKMLAKELHVPVMALSQLNRALEKRPDKRPMMSDLRESGAIEQDADLIAFIYRDEVYNPESDDKGIGEVIIGKQRNGPIGSVRVRFFNSYTRFDNLYEEGD